jgi:hypothetical protein
MNKDEWYAQLFERLGNSKFRSRFHLKQNDIDYINEKGMDTIREHARDFIAKREAPAVIPNDGKQTPTKGCYRPVDDVQHRPSREARPSGLHCAARNRNLLSGVHPKMAQDPAGERAKSGTAGLSRRCDYDMDRERICQGNKGNRVDETKIGKKY